MDNFSIKTNSSRTQNFSDIMSNKPKQIPKKEPEIPPRGSFQRESFQRESSERGSFQRESFQRGPPERTPSERGSFQRESFQRGPPERTPVEKTPVERTPVERASERRFEASRGGFQTARTTDSSKEIELPKVGFLEGMRPNEPPKVGACQREIIRIRESIIQRGQMSIANLHKDDISIMAIFQENFNKNKSGWEALIYKILEEVGKLESKFKPNNYFNLSSLLMEHMTNILFSYIMSNANDKIRQMIQHFIQILPVAIKDIHSLSVLLAEANDIYWKKMADKDHLVSETSNLDTEIKVQTKGLSDLSILLEKKNLVGKKDEVAHELLKKKLEIIHEDFSKKKAELNEVQESIKELDKIRGKNSNAIAAKESEFSKILAFTYFTPKQYSPVLDHGIMTEMKNGTSGRNVL